MGDEIYREPGEASRESGAIGGNGEAEEHARRRGRPRAGQLGADGASDHDRRDAGSETASTPETGGPEAFTFEVQEVAGVKRRRGRQPGNKAKTTEVIDASAIASLFLSLANMLAADLICPEAQLTETEHAMIAAPLVRILARMPPAAVGKVAGWADPVLLVFGIVVWWRRVVRLNAPPKPPEAMPVETVTASTSSPYSPTNGVAESEAERTAAEALERAQQQMGASL